MERTMLSIEADGEDWRVLIGGKPLDAYPCKGTAISTARRFARLRHDATGEPTGVAVPMSGGEYVLVEALG